MPSLAGLNFLSVRGSHPDQVGLGYDIPSLRDFLQKVIGALPEVLPTVVIALPRFKRLRKKSSSIATFGGVRSVSVTNPRRQECLRYSKLLLTDFFRSLLSIPEKSPAAYFL